MPKKAYVQKGDDPSLKQFVDFYKFLQIGRIVRVDNERNVVDIQFSSNPILSKNVPVTNPFFTGRAFIGGMPEVGSIVICGFIKFTNKIGHPIILSYIDAEYFRALNYIYTQGKATDDVLSINDVHDKIGYNIKRLKKRKQYPGDVGLESTHGSEVYLDENILLSDSKLNEILISSIDKTIYSNSTNNHIYTGGARILNGLVIRPNAPTIEPIILENGQLLYVVTDGQVVDANGKAFTEVRTEVKEIANAALDIIEKYDIDDFAEDTSKGRLLVSQILGTLVGNQRSDIERYGKVLRPQIFPSADNSIAIADILCKPNELYNLASAYQLKFGSGSKFDVDKEGHAFVYLAASSSVHPLGAGRSLEFASDGSIRMSIGKTNVGEKSIELDTKGKVLIHYGSDSQTLRSCEWTLDRSLRIIVNGPDIDGYAAYSDYTGNMYEKVRGNKTVDVDGSYTLTVKGKIQENILGAKVENYVNDKMTNYGGDYQEIVVGKKQEKYGEGVVRDIATKGDTENILLGDKKELLTLGSKDVKLIAGSSKETLLLGDKTISIVLGNFTVSVTAGNISIKTLSGTVDVNASTQKVTVNGLLGVDIVSATTVNVKAPLVKIGGTAVQNGVVTGLPGSGPPSHLDYLTGLPLMGSKTVSATF